MVSRKTVVRIWTAFIQAWSRLIRLKFGGRRTALWLRAAVALAWRRFIEPHWKTLIRLSFPLIALVASIIVLFPLLLPQGLPFYGDEAYYIPWTLNTLSNHNLQAWTPGRGASADILSLFPTIMLVGLSGILGQELGVKGYLLLMAWLSAIIPYIATKQLLRHWRILVDPFKLELASGVSGLVSLLFFNNQATVAGSNSFVWNYSLFPILVSSLVIFMDTGNKRQLLTFGVFSVLASVQPFWPYLVGIVGLIYLIYVLALKTNVPGRVKTLKNSLLVLATGMGFNAFWIVPTATSYVFQAGSTFQLYGATGASSLGDIAYLSFWSLQDVLLMGESAHYFFWNHPQNYTLFSIIIPLIAVTSVLIYRRNRAVFFVVAVLIVGVLATAGANPPAGFVYYGLASHLPYGAGAIVRNPTKFVPIITFAYGLLLGLGVTGASSILSSKRLASRIPRKRIFQYSVPLVLVILVLSPLAYGTSLDLQNYTYPRYSPVNIPQEYTQLNNWLTAHSGDYKVMWIPASGAYDWKQYGVTWFPDLMSSKPAVPFTNIYPRPLGSTHNIGRILAFMGVKYVVYHGDSINYPNDQILQELLAQRDLVPVESVNGTATVEDDSSAPLPIGAPGFTFTERPFNMSIVTLQRVGSVNVTIGYTIPQSVVAQGWQGAFSNFFSIGLLGEPAGSSDVNSQVFFATVSHQQELTNTTGRASFVVNAPLLTYPKTSIDLYADYYDGQFKPLTPQYFIDRLTLVPSQIINRYIIFENKDFAGPVFSQSSNILSNSKVTDLLASNASIVSPAWANVTSYQQTSGVGITMTAEASSPFVLILTEPFDGLWRAFIGSTEITPTPIYGLVTGFLIYQTGPVNIRIYYTLQNYLYLGMGLSLASLLLVVLTAVIVQRKSRLKIIASRKTVVAVPIPAQLIGPNTGCETLAREPDLTEAYS